MAPEMIDLAGGESVPVYLVEALDEFEKKWPGATVSQARPGIVAAILNAQKKQEQTEDKIKKELVEKARELGERIRIAEDKREKPTLAIARSEWNEFRERYLGTEYSEAIRQAYIEEYCR